MKEALTDRSSAVLDAVVDQYILDGQPVSSSVVAETLEEEVSSATIRNVMAELERRGFLYQPHTSAGRMPTAHAYRLYVERLLEQDRVAHLNERRLRRRLREEAVEFTDFLQRICRLLVELTDNVGLVLAPPLADAVLQHIDFIRLGAHRVLVVFVARRGWVHNQVTRVEEDVSQETLDRAASYLVDRFSGRPLREVRRRISELLRELGGGGDDEQRFALGLGARSLTPELFKSEILVEGTSRLLGDPDLGSSSDLEVLFETFEERAGLVSLLSDCVDGRSPHILIGSDRLPEALDHCTLVAASYGAGGRRLGTLGVVGPRRMEYAQTIGAVEALARATSKLMSELSAS